MADDTDELQLINQPVMADPELTKGVELAIMKMREICTEFGLELDHINIHCVDQAKLLNAFHTYQPQGRPN